jgi:hypothetical protein
MAQDQAARPGLDFQLAKIAPLVDPYLDEITDLDHLVGGGRHLENHLPSMNAVFHRAIEHGPGFYEVTTPDSRVIALLQVREDEEV